MEQQRYKCKEQSQKLLTSWQRTKLIKLFGDESHTNEKSNEGNHERSNEGHEKIWFLEKQAEGSITMRRIIFLYVLNCVHHHT